jgi:hypothetical protein
MGSSMNNRIVEINFLSAKCMIGLHDSKAGSDNTVPKNKGNGAGNGEEESMSRDQRKKRL